MTIKQAKALKEIVENGRTNVSTVMRKVGYSEAMATHPNRLTKSKAFVEALEAAGITDDKLAQRLNEGLDATYKGQPDFNNRHKYLETNLKLKGHSKETPTNNITIVPIYGGLSARPNDVQVSGHLSNPQSIPASEED